VTNFSTRLVYLFCLVVTPLVTRAIDIPPGQAVAPPPGKTSIRFELNSLQVGEKYKNSESLNTDAELGLHSLGVQYAGSFLIKNKLAGFYLNTSVARAIPSGSIASQDTETGVTDAAAALVTWLVADKEKGRYAVLGTFVILPTGDYDSNRAINFGKNRFAGGFQLGYHTRLSDKFDAMVTTDVIFSAENDDYRLTHQSYKQKPLYSMQFTVMHHINPSLMLSATYYLYNGGEGKLDGISLDDKIKRKRYEVVLSKRVKSGKYFVYAGRDQDTENGFVEDLRLSLRYQHYF
jgi:hypothetical protein